MMRTETYDLFRITFAILFGCFWITAVYLISGYRLVTKNNLKRYKQRLKVLKK